MRRMTKKIVVVLTYHEAPKTAIPAHPQHAEKTALKFHVAKIQNNFRKAE